MTQRLGQYTLQERKRRILERAEACHWFTASCNGGAIGSEWSWRREVAQGLPAILDQLEQALVREESRLARNAAFNADLADADRRRDDAAAEFQRHQDELQRRRMGL